MAGQTVNNTICIGILAHVDAGKTTTAEALLYESGAIRSFGRVDRGDAFLDTDRQEKDRGITIFSKQAVFVIPSEGTAPGAEGETAGLRVQLLDTPGHTDFSAEMERTLAVLDYAILVISGLDGIQAHTETLWELLGRYRVPTFVWVNKMDIARRTNAELLAELKARFGDGCTDFTPAAGSADGLSKETLEEIASLDEAALEEYLAHGEKLSVRTVRRLIRRRYLFPVWFGSSLKREGIDALLKGLGAYAAPKEYPEPFGARVFKITRDERGDRLTWMKITGGSLSVRGALSYTAKDREAVTEKVTGLRIYSGAKYETVETAEAGTVVSALGLTETYAGQGLGIDRGGPAPLLEPVMTYRIVLPDGVDVRTAYAKLTQLAEEDPLLRMAWNAELSEIQVQIMGDVQIEVLERLIAERFGWDVTIDAGRIAYKETIAEPVLGAGHFEPLRHYAEVHLLLEPLPRGSGVVYESAADHDSLAVNWQRLILTNLAEKGHRGVLTGAPLTDVKITLIAGRAHEKHTEGGDFRQASRRAVRQALCKAQNVLLEPFYAFTLEIPSNEVSRAAADLKTMFCAFDPPVDCGGTFRITGKGPAALLADYRRTLLAYTKGTGRLSCRFDGHYPCHNTAEVVAACGYEADRDTENPADSVFCSRGAGITVKWDKADAFMHVDSGFRLTKAGEGAEAEEEIEVVGRPKVRARSLDFDERELEAIMEREFGPIKRPRYTSLPYDPTLAKAPKADPVPLSKQDHLIVDGYNVIHAWEDLSDLAKESLAAARERLIDTLTNYAGFRGCDVVLVFDGYRVPGNAGEKEESGPLRVVYTKEGESADAYIEKLTREIGRNEHVRVATSDGLIQLTCLRTGVMRMSSRELGYEVDTALEQLRALREKTHGVRTTVGDVAPELRSVLK
ncbi:MAG: NYN domain-containing protein [Firmicutes bacterium]|nr:NYN domain-containing protein [Bacillota bacterium]